MRSLPLLAALALALPAGAQDAPLSSAEWRKAAAGVLAGARPKVTACQARALAEGREVSGEIVVSWAVARSGRVPSAVVEKSSLGDEEVEGCILEVVRGLRFEPHADASAFIPMTQRWVLALDKQKDETPEEQGEAPEDI